MNNKGVEDKYKKRGIAFSKLTCSATLLKDDVLLSQPQYSNCLH